MSNPRFLQVVNIGSFLMTVIVNMLANVLPLNGRTTGEISDLYPSLITPANYVFSIWGIIYALLLVFIVYQALPKNREKTFLSRIGYLFALSNIVNVIWIFLWHYDYITLSVIPMFVLLGSLIAIYLRLQIGKSDVPLKEKLCVHLPFSVYLGWITVAPIANVASALVSINWDGWGISAINWAVIVIIIALIITLAVIFTRKDIAYSLVIIWALAGIVVKQMENQSIVMTASASAIIIVIALILVLVSSFLRRK
ncbi:MAG: tryptophan-rich sensory protein [Candidatus Methylarchaceae archaeon HK02M1]|nr:tryptophan-rich sensory protein [Candidatus Methylarchaceae archaeon HK02M1]